jgi:hypothetical protein
MKPRQREFIDKLQKHGISRDGFRRPELRRIMDQAEFTVVETAANA